MNIILVQCPNGSGKKFVALDSEDEDPHFELDTNAEGTDEEEELLTDISEDYEDNEEDDSEEFNEGESGESGDSFIVEDSEDSDYDFEEEIALKYLDSKKKCIKIVDKEKLREDETILTRNLKIPHKP